MKLKLFFLIMCLTEMASAQYFQRIFNYDYVTPQYRNENLNSGIRSQVNFTGGATTNFSIVGIGVTHPNTALPAPYNRADWVRFIRLNRTGTMVNNNRAIEFKDAANNKAYNAVGNSIAEIDNGAGTGGYVAVGAVTSNATTGSSVPGGSDALTVILTTTGMVSFANRLDFGNSKDISWCVRRSASAASSWLICGEATFSPLGAVPYTNCFVARVDNTGNIIWCRTYNFDATVTGNYPTANCIAKQLAEDPTTGNIYVVGYQNDFTGTNGTDGLVFEITSGGAFVGSLLYHLAPDDEFQAVRWTSDGNLIVGGFTNYNPAGTGFYNMLLVKVSPAGVVLFQNILRVSGAGAAYESKCYDLIERVNTAASPEFYLFGPKYVAGSPVQVMYKTDNLGVGINSYSYNAQTYDVGYGIDFANNTFTKPGVMLFSSVTGAATGFSDSHIMKTYFNGAVCTNYCPADPPSTNAMNVNPPFVQPTGSTACTITGINWKNYNFQSQLICNQKTIACGSSTKEEEDNTALKVPGDVQLYPNPTNDLLNITWYNPSEGNTQWKILDMQGRILIAEQENLPEGLVTRQLSLSSLNAGCYIVMITNGSEQFRKVVIKQ